MRSFESITSLLGRILLSVIFIVSGFGKLMDPTSTQGYMAQAHLPAVKVLYPATVLIELGGGLLILLGWKARWAAMIVFLFLIPVTVTFHWDWSNKMQQANFLKNLAIMGGLLTLAAHGPGPVSLDHFHKPRRG